VGFEDDVSEWSKLLRPFILSTIASSVIAEIAMYTLEQSRIGRCYETEEEKNSQPWKKLPHRKEKNIIFFEAVHVSTAMKSQSASNRRQSVEKILHEVLWTTEMNLLKGMDLSGHGEVGTLVFGC